MTWSEARKEFRKSWRKVGRGYKATVGSIEVSAIPVRLPVPPGTGLLTLMKGGGLPRGWEWEFKDTMFNLSFKGYALSLEDAKSDLEHQLMIFHT